MNQAKNKKGGKKGTIKSCTVRINGPMQVRSFDHVFPTHPVRLVDIANLFGVSNQIAHGYLTRIKGATRGEDYFASVNSKVSSDSVGNKGSSRIMMTKATAQKLCDAITKHSINPPIEMDVPSFLTKFMGEKIPKNVTFDNASAVLEEYIQMKISTHDFKKMLSSIRED